MEWVSVEDMLPDITMPVMVWDRYFLMCTAVLHIDNKWLLDATYIDGKNRIELDQVTHWMPLPKPPKNP